MEDELDLIHWRLLLGDPRHFEKISDTDRDFVLRRVTEYLKETEAVTKQRRYNARLHLAAHLSPRKALSYDGTSRYPRHELIREYLVDEFGFDTELVEDLSRSIHKLLDTWDAGRKVVTSHRDRLLVEQNYKCAHCYAKFNSEPVTAAKQDPYKPYYPKTEERLSPEVDHIEPVSTWGTNSIENLQVLCRLCNQGKSDGLGIDAGKEIAYAGERIETIPWHHKASILYYVIRRDRNKCDCCGLVDAELTIRPIRTRGGYTRSNLVTFCVRCAYPN